MSLLQEMLDYCERTGTRPTYLGGKTVGDTTLILQMQRGRKVTDRNASRIRAMMAKHPQGMHTPTPVAKRNPDPCPVDSRAPWEIAADNRAGSVRLAKATAGMAPASVETHRLSHEEKVALVLAGKVGLVSAAIPSRAYDFSLTGGSL